MSWREKIKGHLREIDFSPPASLTVLDTIEATGLVSTAAAWSFPQVCLITADSSLSESAVTAVEEFQSLLGFSSRPVIMVPEVRGERQAWIPENESLRAAALSRAQSGTSALFVASAVALLSPAPNPDVFAESRFTLVAGDGDFGLENLVEKLTSLDYDNEAEVGAPGEFSRRGGIVDIFSPLYEYPARVDFFGEGIESIRFFDPETQRSFRECSKLEIVPRGDACTAQEMERKYSFIDYLRSDAILLLWRQSGIENHLQRFGEDVLQGEWQDFFTRHRSRIVSVAPREEHEVDDAPTLNLEWLSLPENTFSGGSSELNESADLLHWQLLRNNLQRWSKDGKTLVAACGSQGEAERFKKMLEEDSGCREISLEIIANRVSGGIFIPEVDVIILGESELFGKHLDHGRITDRNRYRACYKIGEDNQLTAGDLAVHAVHGIAVYRGIKEITENGVVQEVIELEFSDEVTLYVPLEQAWLVSHYVGGTRRKPSPSKLGGNSWKKARAAAADSAYDLAAELLRIEALRQDAAGYAFEQNAQWEYPFSASFPFSETPDQKEAIKQVLADMERPEPMDRLLCGDVGYGKTEVAIRAAFRAVVNGRQAAVLVPTTLLANQHFHAFRERMAEYPVNIEVLSRFRSEAEQKSILERIAESKIDILIGTHRLLQKDLVFADLGLVVIDEEQRFGVKDKEKLKRMRASVDILTMTATPIPRTLYFSLSGVRNLSTIMTPPAERLPVTTVVAQIDDKLIRAAVLRELERSGQLFFLHNRVRTIESVVERLRELVPEADFVMAHGQMPAHELEEAMDDYINRRADVLVCTTIIESGLDIPNANTIIVENAERFGLAELYQLRGRVGRYHHQAYAYFLLSPQGAPTGNARQRMTAIRQYTALGAGMNLALRDMEIRGAGNILGSEQSGHIAAVGFDFYCELLHESVARLRNEKPSRGVRSVIVNLPGIEFGVRSHSDRKKRRNIQPAGIPAWYIESEQLRLQYYRKISGLKKEADLTDLEEEMKDRFGELPEEVGAMLELAGMRLSAAELNVHSVSVRNRKIFLETPSGVIRNKNGKLPLINSEEPLEQVREINAWLRDKRRGGG